MQYICSKTGDEGSIYAARQGMRAVYMSKTGDEGSIYAARQGMRGYMYILSYIETFVGYLMCLKELIAATLESSELLHLYLNGRVSAIPT